MTDKKRIEKWQELIIQVLALLLLLSTAYKILDNDLNLTEWFRSF